MSRSRLLFRRWRRSARGQDLVEYALLAALIGVSAAATAPAIETAISAAYVVWNTQNQDLWLTPDPTGS